MPTPERLQKLLIILCKHRISNVWKRRTQKKSPELTARDERDIAKDLNNIMQKLTSGEAGPASYDGEELDPEAAELFRDELEIALRRLKIINKENILPKIQKVGDAMGEIERIKRLVSYYENLWHK